MSRNSTKLDFSIPIMVTREQDENKRLTCNIVELNPAGLLVHTQTEFTAGENLTVHLLRDKLEFKVISCQDSEQPGHFTCQLTKLDEEMNLDLYFSSFSKLAG